MSEKIGDVHYHPKDIDEYLYDRYEIDTYVTHYESQKLIEVELYGNITWEKLKTLKRVIERSFKGYKLTELYPMCDDDFIRGGRACYIVLVFKGGDENSR